MASLIIGISGRKRSGKDTLAARLIEAHGFTRVSFAEPLRAMALAVDPWVRVEADELGLLYQPGTFWDLGIVHRRLSEVVTAIGWERAKEIREVRRLLQVIGTEAGRQILGEDVWVDAAARVIEAIPGRVVITDVRFPNEADFVESHPEGTYVRVTRPGLESTDLHPSETALDGHPAIHVTNDSDVAALHRQADLLVEALGL